MNNELTLTFKDPSVINRLDNKKIGKIMLEKLFFWLKSATVRYRKYFQTCLKSCHK